ncbi:MarR family winged helix-turn-helix transcriptional regulator [Arthrobacter sp. NEB 688]|uniref:MarR family winged helix-turn-helix transcriptional regulator n=1 Tax=Arthrobacter sp. NEB 688 TaxID=904039 RepID=UPI002570E868|nr:MarR family winged helix-turn-helix transcriptional regulator [Arthrobacter sp. NEB 688]
MTPVGARRAAPSPEQLLLSDSALAVFRLNGQFLALAEELARPAGLTAAWWQVLGAVLPAPMPVSGIAREMGLTRQSVQRIADLLVERGFAAYRDNPAHRRAKLVEATPAGVEAVRAIAPQHRAAARRLVEELGEQRAVEVRDTLRELVTAMERLGDGA